MTKTEATNIFIVLLSVLGIMIFVFTQQAIAQNDFCTGNNYSAMANINGINACINIEEKEIYYRPVDCSGFMRTDCFFTEEEKLRFVTEDFSDWVISQGLNTSKP